MKVVAGPYPFRHDACRLDAPPRFGEILGGGDLQVLRGRLDDVDGVARAFRERRFVGRLHT